MQLVTPRQFCRIYFGLDDLPEEIIQQEEKSFGYKTRCAAALASVLDMSPSTLINIRYGKGIDFENMDIQCRMILSYWLMERHYQQKIARLEEHVRYLESRLRRRAAA